MANIWFAGSIAESIAESKRRNAVFIVFACDSSEKTKEMEDTLNDSDVANVVTDSVLIKVEQSTTSFTQFTQFYPVMIVPTTYLIAPNGTPLEIIAGSCSKEDLISKIQSTKEKFRQQAELSNVQPSSEEASNAAPSSASIEERTKYAQEKLEEIRRKKQAEAQAAEIEDEKRRKAQMSELTRAKQEAEEREMKQIAEERRREKEEDRLAREAIKARIAQDKADRAAKFSKEKADSETANLITVQSQPTPPPAFDGIVRIQLRFPDGTHETMTAPAESQLLELKQSVLTNYCDRIGSGYFNLAVPYPRRVFTDEEMSETLESLSLIPSTVLVVLPLRGKQTRSAPSANSSNQSVGFIGQIFALFAAFFTFLMSIFTGGNRERNLTDGQSARTTGGQSSSREVAGSSSSDLRRRKKDTEKPESRNIHRLNSKDNDDDENNTWNGNSTQQM